MKKELVIVTSLLAVAGGIAIADVAASFEQQPGGESGKGELHGVPFIWESSNLIEKTMLAAMTRVSGRHQLYAGRGRPFFTTECLEMKVDKT
jgi:hypothetical protein